MKNQFRLYRRGRKGSYYSQDNQTGKQKSLNTTDKKEALRLLHTLNEAHQQPAMNLQIARAYLLASDPRHTSRTWRYVFDAIVSPKQNGSTKERWLRVAADKSFKTVWDLPLVQTTADHLLAVLGSGKVSTNIFLRRLHNYAVDMAWIPCAIIPKKKWPAIVFKERRAITLEEHARIIEREKNPERRAFYEFCWHFGGSQSDIANLRAEDFHWQTHVLCYVRMKPCRHGRIA